MDVKDILEPSPSTPREPNGRRSRRQRLSPSRNPSPGQTAYSHVQEASRHRSDRRDRDEQPEELSQQLNQTTAAVSPQKRSPAAEGSDWGPPQKKQSKWTRFEDTKIIELRGGGMRWADISTRLPGRSDIACRLHYQNYLEKRGEWDEEKKNILARVYERLKPDLWGPIGNELGVPWRAAEAMHWAIGEQEMARRANVLLFTLTTASPAGEGHGRVAASNRMHESTMHFEACDLANLNLNLNAAAATQAGGGGGNGGPVSTFGQVRYDEPGEGGAETSMRRANASSEGNRLGRLPSLRELVQGVSPYPDDDGARRASHGSIGSRRSRNSESSSSGEEPRRRRRRPMPRSR